MASTPPGTTPLTIPPSSAPASPVSQKSQGGPVLTTPAVRKIAKENSIDLHLLQGTGPKGRILKEDVLNFIKTGGKSSQPAAPTAPSSPPQSKPESISPAPHSTPPSRTPGAKTVVPIRGIQRIMVKSMTASLQVPHLGYCEEVVMDSLVGLRKQLKHALDRKGSSHVKLSYMPFILKV
jgi:2-oxoisovalerate dehydrogenase E2 component (dihydrolipoyl transacylase)